VAEPAAAAVSARALGRTFGAFVAVDGVSFDVARGEVFGFLGPNGAGKTTVIKMLAGLLRPTSGAATVAGRDVAADADAIKRRIGYMSQLFSLYADLTVEENIAFFAGLYGVAGERRSARRDWVLRMARLSDQRARLVRELSLGFKQRLALGCAALHEPEILFLDEPTSGVDPVSRRSFWDLIYALADAGTTVFVTTHYLEEAEYCHRLALMNRGRLVAADTPSGLKKAMREPLLELRTSDAPRAARALRDVPEVLAAGMFGRALHLTVTDPRAARPAIERALAGAGLSAGALEPIPPSLEDVFIHLVRAAGGAVSG
jgi:ABC-2 type transport system ATP-binding protein